MSEYPEHEKLKAVKDDSHKIGEFLEWIDSQQLTICETYHDPAHARRRLGRPSPGQPCELRDGEYFPTRHSIQTLLAKYFDIDLKKIEEEKQMMIERLRRGAD